MLSSTMDLDTLPWDQSHQGPLQPATILSQDSTTLTKNEEESVTEHIELAPRPKVASQSIEINSVAARPEWAIDEAPVGTILKEVSYDTFRISSWNLMAEAQKYLSNSGFQWFHPDLLTIYGRLPDGSFYFSISASYRTTDDVSITIRLHKGEFNQFETFVSDLKMELSLF